MKVIVMGGYPGSGKSTIVKEALEHLLALGHVFTLKKYGKLIPYMESNQGLIVFGTYGPTETFPGTDRFPMNAQPEAMQFLLELQANEGGQHGKERTVLFEGDRLFNQKMLQFLEKEGFNVVLCVVSMNRKLLEQRRNKRSDQNATWRKGRETKVDRISMSQPVQHMMTNNTEKDMLNCADELVKEINGEWKQKKVHSKIKDLWK